MGCTTQDKCLICGVPTDDGELPSDSKEGKNEDQEAKPGLTKEEGAVNTYMP